MAGQSPARRAERARRAVEEAARETFVERGYEGASVDEIARRAGVSKPTVYAHFGAKEDLFVHILEGYCARLLTPILCPDAAKMPLCVVLNDFARQYARVVLDPDVVALHRLFCSEAQRFPELGQRYYAAGPQAVHKELARFFEQRMAAGQLRRCDPIMLAEQFSGLVLTPLRLKMLFSVIEAPDPGETEAYCIAAVDLFVQGAVPAAPA